MAKTALKCTKCKHDLIKSYDNGVKKLRTNIVVFDGDECVAKCLNCKSDQVIPLTLNPINRKKRKGAIPVLIS